VTVELFTAVRILTNLAGLLLSFLLCILYPFDVTAFTTASGSSVENRATLMFRTAVRPITDFTNACFALSDLLKPIGLCSMKVGIGLGARFPTVNSTKEVRTRFTRTTFKFLAACFLLAESF